MKTNVTFSDFCDRFRNHDRQNSFTYEGKRALFDYLEELEASTGEETELDVVALDCEYVEYASSLDWAMDYHGTECPTEACEAVGIDESIAMSTDASDIEDAILEHLRGNTQIIEFDKGIIVQNF